MDQPGVTFNLLDEPWIPVLYRDGRFERVGIKRALVEAPKIRQIAASNPMDNVAVIRFLLGLFYWCKGNPPSQIESTDEGIPESWLDRLDSGNFYLFGEGKRFFQYRAAKVKKSAWKTANYLIHEVPTGTNKWHFRHSIDERDGLCPACCALGLLRLPMFATSAGAGKSPGINSKPPIYAVPVGESLATTLRMSWRKHGNLGTPAWERSDVTLPPSGEVPLLTGLSWLPRQVWLESPGEPEAACMACAQVTRLVRKCTFAGLGGNTGSERFWRDPHVLYNETTSLHASDALGSKHAASDQWTKIADAVVSNGLTKGNLWVVGFSTVQNDKYLEVVDFVVPLPESSDGASKFKAMCEQWQKQVLGMARKARPPEQKEREEFPEIDATLTSVRSGVERHVSTGWGDLWNGAPELWIGAAAEYRPMLAAVAQSVAPGCTTTAASRRERIAAAVPDMGARAVATQTARHKKKGGAV